MKRFFLALVCAVSIVFGTASASYAADAVTFTCDGFARNQNAMVRKQWFGIGTIPGTVRDRGKDITVLVAFSGDPELDTAFRKLAPMTKPPFDTPRKIVSSLEWMINMHVRSLGQILDGESRAACWKSGTPAPDRSGWPGKTFTCAGVVWARTLHDGVDISPIWPRWGMFRNVPTTNQSSAESMLRARLLDAARKKAIADHGSLLMAADQSNGIPSSESMVCWDDSPPTSAPMGWPERIWPWARVITALDQFSEWIEEMPPPTVRVPGSR